MTGTGADSVQERRGGLIVPVIVAETAIRPEPSECVPIWSGGIPAHVTLLFPFPRMEQLDPAGLADLKALFAGTLQIRATFSTVGRFPDVVYLAPEPRDWFIRLTEALSKRYGLLPYGGIFPSIVPHLTVARDPDPAVSERIAAALERYLPLETDVREVWLMEEEADGRWTHAATFPLGEEPADRRREAGGATVP
jgi:2'-5' RNA ligase